MDDNIIYSINPRMQYAQRTSMSNVRILHTVPDAPNMDVYFNGQLIATNLAYGKNTEYIPIPEGTYEVSLYVTKTKDTPVISNTLIVNRNTIITVVATGYLRDIALYAIPDANTRINPDEAMLRFAHLSPNAPAVDITLPDGTILFDDVSYKQLKPYISVSPNNYTLHVRLAGTTTVLLVITNVNLEANKFYTIYAIGSIGKKPELESLLLLDGK